MNELALFAGAGGGILGGHLLGWRTVCAVEIEDYPRRVLLQRQADGILPRFPIWDDVTTFDGKPWKGRVDVISGGFPCQDISTAGKGAGLKGEKSGLWFEMQRIIGEVRPKFVLVENSPVLTSRGLGTVLGDLASMGYDAKWGVLGADNAGAPHRRKRIWIVAHASQIGCNTRTNDPGEECEKIRRDKSPVSCQTLANPNCLRKLQQERFNKDIGGRLSDRSIRNSNGQRLEERDKCQPQGPQPTPFKPNWWDIEPGLGRVANGVAHRVDRLKAIGNGQVPSVVRLAWEMLSE